MCDRLEKRLAGAYVLKLHALTIVDQVRHGQAERSDVWPSQEEDLESFLCKNNSHY